MSAYTPPEFSEELFSVMLESCNPSRVCVEALTQMALHHLPRASDTWSALRKALVRQTELDADANRALWYLLDALLKHAPHVFVPLVAPRLAEYVAQQLPTRADWADALTDSWDAILPVSVRREVQSLVRRRKGAMVLTAAMEKTASNASAATAEETQRLREAWDALHAIPTRAPNAPNHSQEREEVEEREESQSAASSAAEAEYVPELMRGARRREMPSLYGNGETKPRRIARRRPREDEE